MHPSEQEIFLFIHMNNEVRYTELMKHVTMSEKTCLKYLFNLMDKEKVDKKLSEKTKRPVYFIPPEHQKEAEKLRLQEKIFSGLKGFSLNQLMKTYKEMIADYIFSQYPVKPLSPEELDDYLKEAGFSDEDIQRMWVTDHGQPIVDYLDSKLTFGKK